MRSGTLALCAISISCGTAEAAAVQPARSSPAATTRIPADIERFFGSYFSAVESGDPDAILSHIHSDFVIVWPVGEAVTDRARLRAALAALQKRVRQGIRWGIDEAHVHGGWAWVRSWEAPTHHPKAGGDPVTLEGSRLTILRKVKGRWLIHRDHGSLNKLPVAR